MMTDEERQRLASEAAKVRDNEAVQHALQQMRDEALSALVIADPTDVEGIRKHQVTVTVIDEFFGRIDATIRNGQPKRKPGLA